MPRSDKSKYTDKQKRQAEHIEAGYRRRGISEEVAERRAWATVNKIYGGGKKPGGSGYGKPVNQAPIRKGGKKGGASASRPALSGLLQRRRPPEPVSRRGGLTTRKTWGGR